MTLDPDGADFEHPLSNRYASRAMAGLFSPRSRHEAWRDLWIALADAEAKLGLPVRPAQVDALRAARDSFDWARLAVLEKELRHDVMAHVHHFGECAPDAKGVIHLGATSCFVTDNADLVIYRDALTLLGKRLQSVLAVLGKFAGEHRDHACLGFTHYQVAQPVTVGKRACLWAQDFCLDLDEVQRIVDWLPFRGVKGTTGTQASFLTLCGGDGAKVDALDHAVAQAMGFDRIIPVSGQTYTRKIDWTIMQALSGIAQSAAKWAHDIRLLSHDNELEEPSESKQIGSSAMAYKKNPMRSERVCSLARFVIETASTAAHTASTQWLERTLDDSAVRRISLPECFMAADAMLMLAENVVQGLVVWPEVIKRRLGEQLPFLATEEILMAAVAAGGDRQDLHERIRIHSREAATRVKAQGGRNELLDLLAGDPAFAAVAPTFGELLDPKRFIGRAPEQVDRFLADELAPRVADRGAAPEAEIRV